MRPSDSNLIVPGSAHKVLENRKLSSENSSLASCPYQDVTLLLHLCSQSSLRLGLRYRHPLLSGPKLDFGICPKLSSNELRQTRDTCRFGQQCQEGNIDLECVIDELA